MSMRWKLDLMVGPTLTATIASETSSDTGLIGRGQVIVVRMVVIITMFDELTLHNKLAVGSPTNGA